MLKIFSGSANYELTLEVCKNLNLPLAQSRVTRFDNSEIKVTIQEKVKDDVCIVIQPTANPTDTHLMELLFFADALKRKGAQKIIAFIPYFGYARQNREHLPGEAVSVNVVIRFIETIGFNQVFTIDLHDEGTEGIFSIPFKNLSAFSILGKKIYKYLGNNSNKKIAVVSPDQGGVERAQNFADNFFNTNKSEIVVIEKKRNLNVAHQSEALNLFGDVKGKTCIIVDDIVTSGGTLVHAADFCLKKGAKEVIACIVHHDFSKNAISVLKKSHIKKIFVTNTIKLNEDQKINNLEEVSISSLISKEIELLK